MQAPGIQQTVSKDMAPFGIGAELDFINGQKIAPHALGHRLNRADPIGRTRRHDPLFSGHKRHDAGATHSHNPVVNLARQEPQRQADHTGAVGQHPFNRVVRLASIRRPKHGRDPGHRHILPRTNRSASA